MITRIVVSVEAGADLDGIYDYIATDLASPDSARRITQKITKRIITLRNFPRAGKSLADTSERLAGYRLLVVDKYLVFYRYDDETAVVLRVVHALLDYTRLF